jgi:dolichyl-phosphate-mannose-protein mannosyltransferase
MGDTRRKSPEIPDEESPAMSLLALPDRPVATSHAAWNDRDAASRFLSRTDVRLGIVLVVCFIPRVIAAWRLPAACDDAYYYLHVADSLQGGRVARALEYLNINVYPMVLIGLHRMGLDWILAAKMWGVLAGTAIVLPLFDWLRRMFNDRIALLAVFLYAVHPRIVEPTVEPLREATFWLFFVVCLDLFWRAAEERRTWQFAAGGLSLALALHTRIEAWFLLAPLGVWMGMSWWQSRTARPRLVLGTLLCLAITPIFVFTVNVTLLAHHYQWELGRLSPFLLVEKWIHAPVTNELAKAPPAAAASRPTAVDTPIPQPNTSIAIPTIPHAEGATKLEGTITGSVSVPRQYFREMARTLGVVFLVLTGIGFVRGGRELLDPRKAVLGLLTLAVLLAIWVRVTEIGNLNGRYFLLLVFLDAPFTAIGALVVIRQLERLDLERAIVWLRTRRVAPLFLSCLLVAGWTEASLAHHSHRGLQTRLGRWIEQQAGPFHSVVADFNAIRPAYTVCHGMPDVVTFDEFYDLRMDRYPPDLAIFYPDGFRQELLPHLVIRAAKLGLTPLDLSAFSSSKPEFVVFVRNRH